MSNQYDIGIFGGDLRQVYMAEAFLANNYRVAAYSINKPIRDCYTPQSLKELFELSTVMIGPIPMSRDRVTITAKDATADLTITHIADCLKEQHILFGGNIPSQLRTHCDSRHILYYDLMEDEKITILNAIATAEGTIMEAIAASDINLHGSTCLILGYGRCAKVLARKLRAMDMQVTIGARSEEALAYALADGLHTVHLADMKETLHSYSFLFNTIPSLILNKSCLDLVNPYVTIIDIASAPGGVDFEYAKQLGINAKLSLGLPGKVAPKTSADILVTEIIAKIRERSD